MNKINHPLDLYVLATLEGRIEDAKKLLLIALLDENSRHSPSIKAGIIQRLANLLFGDGDISSARILYCISEDIDPGSLLAKYEHAKFLLEEISDTHATIEKCDEIIRIAHEKPFLETDDDFSSEQYINAANNLKLSAISKQPTTE